MSRHDGCWSDIIICSHDGSLSECPHLQRFNFLLPPSGDTPQVNVSSFRAAAHLAQPVPIAACWQYNSQCRLDPGLGSCQAAHTVRASLLTVLQPSVSLRAAAGPTGAIHLCRRRRRHPAGATHYPCRSCTWQPPSCTACESLHQELHLLSVSEPLCSISAAMRMAVFLGE